MRSSSSPERARSRENSQHPCLWCLIHGVLVEGQLHDGRAAVTLDEHFVPLPVDMASLCLRLTRREPLEPTICPLQKWRVALPGGAASRTSRVAHTREHTHCHGGDLPVAVASHRRPAGHRQHPDMETCHFYYLKAACDRRHALLLGLPFVALPLYHSGFLSQACTQD